MMNSCSHINVNECRGFHMIGKAVKLTTDRSMSDYLRWNTLTGKAPVIVCAAYRWLGEVDPSTIRSFQTQESDTAPRVALFFSPVKVRPT